MAEIKYVCKQCRRNFNETQAVKDGDKRKCPFCDSEAVKKTSKTLEFLRSILYSGGG